MHTQHIGRIEKIDDEGPGDAVEVVLTSTEIAALRSNDPTTRREAEAALADAIRSAVPQ